MKKATFVFWFSILISSQIIAQLELTVKFVKQNTYGVYVRVQEGHIPSKNIVTGTGQVTLVLSEEVKISFSTVHFLSGTDIAVL